MANTYKQDWASYHPGCMIFLLDQSGSMGSRFGQSQAGRNQRNCYVVANILNSYLNELILTIMIPKADGTSDVRPRAEICVLGYEGSHIESILSGALAGRDFVSLPELQQNPAYIEMRKQKDTDETGQEYEVDVPFPIWVRPKAGAGTPMCGALQHARDLAYSWTVSHPDSYPPVIVNVTDGAATDGDPTNVAQEITQITTSDGQALLFSVHITDLNSQPTAYPSSETELPNDRYAKLLFSISSIIPESSRALLETLLGRQVPQGARGMIFNGDATSVRLMFNFASKPRTQPLDPNM